MMDRSDGTKTPKSSTKWQMSSLMCGRSSERVWSLGQRIGMSWSELSTIWTTIGWEFNRSVSARELRAKLCQRNMSCPNQSTDLRVPGKSTDRLGGNFYVFPFYGLSLLAKKRQLDCRVRMLIYSNNSSRLHSTPVAEPLRLCTESPAEQEPAQPAVSG